LFHTLNVQRDFSDLRRSSTLAPWHNLEHKFDQEPPTSNANNICSRKRMWEHMERTSEERKFISGT